MSHYYCSKCHQHYKWCDCKSEYKFPERTEEEHRAYIHDLFKRLKEQRELEKENK